MELWGMMGWRGVACGAWRSWCRCCSTAASPRQTPLVTCLRNGGNGAELYLLGSCHVSTGSARDVRQASLSLCPTLPLLLLLLLLLLPPIPFVSFASAPPSLPPSMRDTGLRCWPWQLIRSVNPSIVAIELCKERAANLSSGKSGVAFRDFFKFPGDLGQKALTFALTWFYDLLREGGLDPGEEFRVAIEEGKQLGAEIAFIDEDIHVTMARVRRGVSLRAVFSFLVHSKFRKTLKMVDEPSIEAYIRTGAWKETLEFLEIYFPDVINALLYQRNKLMVKRLREFEGKIVGVVGLAHIDGMQKLWEEAERSVDR